ncbi:hypothetical protein A6E01_20575 (plasmid) [Vibrio breoganii]|uniref:Uncharacterized protein n=1 Tax=Vibrio breoganii TaxID=553239 RepID=A0AAN0XZP5_9VIBR|nr:hypothetical protein [Vibrio breoganii]ANO35609.1 hypothetical protein A6E01_20575 [Vibrio breoganii]PML10953.1 hypothetical protein BCT84_03570 [Vibrio breoganii]
MELGLFARIKKSYYSWCLDNLNRDEVAVHQFLTSPISDGNTVGQAYARQDLIDIQANKVRLRNKIVALYS